MQRMRARRLSQRSTGGTTDEVIGGISLPSDSVVHSVSGTMKAHALANSPLTEAYICAVEGYVLPVLDVDAAVSFDTIWDNLVPKDTDVQSMDLDTEASDASNFNEPGEADWSSLLDVGLRPKKVFQRQRLISFANSSTGFNINSSNVLGYVPTISWQLGLDSGPFRVSQPSVLLFAIASPGMADTTSTVETASVENEWARHKYIEQVVEDAMKDLFGLVEAGAETPWVEATDLLQKLLEPAMMEETAGSFNSMAWHSFTDMVIEYSVQGRLGKMTLDTGR